MEATEKDKQEAYYRNLEVEVLFGLVVSCFYFFFSIIYVLKWWKTK